MIFVLLTLLAACGQFEAPMICETQTVDGSLYVVEMGDTCYTPIGTRMCSPTDFCAVPRFRFNREKMWTREEFTDIARKAYEMRQPARKYWVGQE
jgi:hypothetical protein